MPPVENPAEVSLAPENVEKLRKLVEGELRLRRVFVAGKFSLRERQRCSLVVAHPLGGDFSVDADAVYIKADEPGAGVGLDLVGLDADKLAELEEFVRHTAADPVEDASDADREPIPRNIHERIRRLSSTEREKLARRGQLTERVALERAYGSTVWEGLLLNPSLTAPEVAQIAKKGTITQSLVNLIVGNAGWLSSGEVRRSLLGNPRVTGQQLTKVLRAAPKIELKQIAMTSPYRTLVRSTARKMMDK